MGRLVSLWLPTWPTDRLRLSRDRNGAGNADTRADAEVLVARRGNRREVVAANAEARAMGVCDGDTLSHVRARFPAMVVGDADPAEDAAGLLRILRAAQRRYSPLVALDPPDGLWIEVTGASHLWGGEAAMLAAMAGWLEKRGIAARAAVAGTAGAAHALARYGQAGLHVLQGDTGDALRLLPAEALRLTAGEAAALQQIGLSTIGELMRAPRGALGRRYGLSVLRRLSQALGEIAEPLAWQPIIEPLSVRLGFLEPTASPDALHGAIARLVPLLCERLAFAGRGVRRLDLLFERVDGSVAAVRAGSSRPSRDAAHLSGLLTLLVERIDPGFGVEGARLCCPLSAPLGPEQAAAGWRGPVNGVEGADPARIAGLIDRLTARLGDGAVWQAVPLASDLPERSFARVPALEGAGAGWPQRLARPTRLLDPPEPVQAIAMLPDRAPAVFVWRGRRHRVRAADGPERVYGEWWKAAGEAAEVRDYFIVEDEEGQRFWLFRTGDGENGDTGGMEWKIQGLCV